MPDGQGQDRRLMAKETPATNARPPHSRTDRQSLTCELVARPHQGLADNPVCAFGLIFGFEPVGHEGIRDAAGMHVAQAAWAFETAAKQRAPTGPLATDPRFRCQGGRSGRYLLRHWSFGCDGTHQPVAQRQSR